MCHVLCWYAETYFVPISHAYNHSEYCVVSSVARGSKSEPVRGRNPMPPRNAWKSATPKLDSTSSSHAATTEADAAAANVLPLSTATATASTLTVTTTSADDDTSADAAASESARRMEVRGRFAWRVNVNAVPGQAPSTWLSVRSSRPIPLPYPLPRPAASFR